MIKTVLTSVSNKKSLVILLETLHKLGVTIFSSGGSAEEIKRLGYIVTDIFDYTNCPEAPDCLVKTLHHKIYCGILLDPSNSKLFWEWLNSKAAKIYSAMTHIRLNV